VLGVVHALGFGGQISSSPPTILTFTLPAISDETVDCAVTASNATHFTVVAHGAAAPVWGVGVWTAVGETHVHTTALSGSIELDAYAYGPGGVSVAPVAEGTTVGSRTKVLGYGPEFLFYSDLGKTPASPSEGADVTAWTDQSESAANHDITGTADNYPSWQIDADTVGFLDFQVAGGEHYQIPNVPTSATSHAIYWSMSVDDPTPAALEVVFAFSNTWWIALTTGGTLDLYNGSQKSLGNCPSGKHSFALLCDDVADTATLYIDGAAQTPVAYAGQAAGANATIGALNSGGSFPTDLNLYGIAYETDAGSTDAVDDWVWMAQAYWDCPPKA